MPGVLKLNINCGFNREVGKMASFFDPDILHTFSDDDTLNFAEIAAHILMEPMSVSTISSGGESADSDSELPDNEQTVDLIKFIDSQDHLDEGCCLHHLKCGDDSCSKCGTEATKLSKYGVRTDPFMGMGGTKRDSSVSSTSSNSTKMTQLDCDFDHCLDEFKDHSGFKAWGHIPKRDDDLFFSTNAISSNCYEEDSEDIYFPDTPSPSSRSGTVTGDDSDVDIETISDAPRVAYSSGYTIRDSLPALSLSSSPGPLRNSNTSNVLSILTKNLPESPSSSEQSSPTSTKHISLNPFRVSSKVSLAENLLASRSSLLGQKRKLSKDKKCVTKVSAQPAYTHVLCNSNSVNFHDYAMSPGACAYPSLSPSTSTETGRPTVLSRRIYKRKQISVDASDKEKQHHHNQLERNRRQKLADLFTDLRDEVPKIANQAKASKVVILNESTVYIRELQQQDKFQEDEISKELHRKEMLRKQLRQLEAQISRNCVK